MKLKTEIRNPSWLLNQQSCQNSWICLIYTKIGHQEELELRLSHLTLTINKTLPQSVLKIYIYCTKLLTLEKAGYLKESVTHLLKSRITAWDCPTKETTCRINNILQNRRQVIRLSYGIKFDINVETVSDIRQIIHAIWHYFLVCSRHQVQ